MHVTYGLGGYDPEHPTFNIVEVDGADDDAAIAAYVEELRTANTEPPEPLEWMPNRAQRFRTWLQGGTIDS